MNSQELNQMAKDANADVVWKAGEVDDGSEDNQLELAKEEEDEIQEDTTSMEEKMNTILPTTREEVLQNLEHEGEDKNFLAREAHKHGVDFDEDTKDEFNRNINNN